MDWWLLVIILVLAGLAVLSYAIGALDVKGAIASFLLGLVVALAGGLPWLALLATFTAAGVLATKFGFARKQARRTAEARSGERGIQNVIANGGAATLAATTLWMAWVPDVASELAFAAAVAAVMADTLASELGSIKGSPRSIMPPFQTLKPGDNGGVTWNGQLSALAGAVFIAVLAVPLLGLPWHLVWVPALAGFLGCQLDSVLGATLEGDLIKQGPLSKDDVNFIASAVPAFIVLVIGSL